MGHPLETLGFSIDGTRSQAELYGLLTEARIKFALALKATALDAALDSEGVDAGHEIFISAYHSLADSRWASEYQQHSGVWIVSAETGQTDVLHFPILHALDFFLDTQQTVCLASWRYHTGNPNLDRAIVSWPRQILHDATSKKRFFFDLLTSYEGVPPEKPLLSNSRARAAQLLTVGRELIERQMKKVGEPKIARIFLPDGESLQ